MLLKIKQEDNLEIIPESYLVDNKTGTISVEIPVDEQTLKLFYDGFISIHEMGNLMPWQKQVIILSIEGAKNLISQKEYLDKVSDEISKNNSFRVGQIYFNILYECRPDLADLICGTELDPFHKDELLLKFKLWLNESW